MRAKKRFGQHFLEAAWADKLVAAIDPRPDDRFVEIGPGPGALTLRLAPRVAQLTAVELDPAMVEMLRPRRSANVTLVHADFLDFDLASLAAERPFRVAGNLPYNVSSPILFALIGAHRRAGRHRGRDADAAARGRRRGCTRRRAAATTACSPSSCSCMRTSGPCWRSRPGAFRPMPKVHSAVVHLRFRPPAVALCGRGARSRPWCGRCSCSAGRCC